MISPETTIKERCELLSATPWAEGMTAHELQTISVYMYMAKIDKDEVILREGKNDSFLSIIIKGKAQVTKRNDMNRPVVIATLNAGKAFGEMSILDGEPHSADVTATEDSTLLILTKDKLNQMVQEKPSIGAKLLFKLAKVLSQRLRMMDGKIVDYL